MDFNARQYDPQIGRFLSIDPLADRQGQQLWSPYAAMGNAPESQVDPNGTSPQIYTVWNRPFNPFEGRNSELSAMPTAETLMPWGDNFGKGKPDLSWADGFDWKASEAFWGNMKSAISEVGGTSQTLYSEGTCASNKIGNTDVRDNGGMSDLIITTQSEIDHSEPLLASANDEVPVNWVSATEKENTHVLNAFNNFSYETGDNIFYVFAHGNRSEIANQIGSQFIKMFDA